MEAEKFDTVKLNERGSDLAILSWVQIGAWFLVFVVLFIAMIVEVKKNDCEEKFDTVKLIRKEKGL